MVIGRNGEVETKPRIEHILDLVFEAFYNGPTIIKNTTPPMPKTRESWDRYLGQQTWSPF